MLPCDTYAVFGNPIAHSKSPLIHAAFARQTGQKIEYIPVLAPLDGFAVAVREFQQAGGKGLNITVPFKEQAYALATVRSPRAERAKAVNTLWFGSQGERLGDNTDGVGLARDLTQNWQTSLCGQTILLLGAGGAARGVIAPLLEQHPAAITIANRTVDKALALADEYPNMPVCGCGYTALVGQSFSLLINATSAGLHDELPPLPAGVLQSGGVAYDMVYGNQATAFMRWAKEQGAGKICDGLGMLVEQAAEAFFLWRGVRPDTAPVIHELRYG